MYAIGGSGGNGKEVERFDLQTRLWEACAPLVKVGGYNVVAVVLKGHLYVLGGGDEGRAMERFSEATNAWEACAAIPRTKDAIVATVVAGKAYVLSDQELDCFDPDTEAWEALPDAPSSNTDGALVAHDKFLFALGDSFPASAIVDRYDTVRRVWERHAPMPAPRGHCGAVLLRGRIYVVGGFNTSGHTEATVFRYDPTTDVWGKTACAPLPTPRYGLAVCAVNDERILAIGGWSDSGVVATVEEYNPDSNSWSTCPSMPTTCYYLAAACM